MRTESLTPRKECYLWNNHFVLNFTDRLYKKPQQRKGDKDSLSIHTSGVSKQAKLF